LITKEQLIRCLDFGESFTQEIKLYTEVTVERTYGFEPIELSSSQIARIFEFNPEAKRLFLSSQIPFPVGTSIQAIVDCFMNS
jgi:hypothetical protein